MKRYPPHPHVEVCVPLATYQMLCSAAARSHFEREDWEIANDAILQWLAHNEPDTIGLPTIRGLQWKEVFLAEGTVLRTIFQGKNHHAVVEGDRLQHNGQASSPHEFANAVGGSGRNAWKVIWVLMPGESTWKRADSLRQAKSNRRKH
jgi:hypothetical protein